MHMLKKIRGALLCRYPTSTTGTCYKFRKPSRALRRWPILPIGAYVGGELIVQPTNATTDRVSGSTNHANVSIAERLVHRIEQKKHVYY